MRKRSFNFHLLSLFFLLFLRTVAVAQTQSVDTFGLYKPNSGFKLASTKMGEINLKIFADIRYLNQLGLDTGYVNSFGDTSFIDRRQDIQVNKVNIQFHGWLMDPKFRYLFYVWTSNTSQGLSAQVVVAGNLQYTFNKHLTIGGGISSLPGVRSTEGNFPFWLTVDNRLIADEFFRPSYTSGFWVKGKVFEKLSYTAMIGNNLSQLGVDAGQLDNNLGTYSGGLIWLPTTGEFGLNNNFGDFENHQKVATRVAGHFSRSAEDRQGQPNTDAFENVTIRLSDGSIIWTPNLFGSGIRVDYATYNMASFDAGIKFKGFSIDAEYYRRWVNSLEGPGTENFEFDELSDNGFQMQASCMLLKETLQLYAGASMIYGEYGDPSEFRTGLNWFPWKNHVVRCNLEYIYLQDCPVGGLSLPYLVGSNGSIFHADLQISF